MYGLDNHVYKLSSLSGAFNPLKECKWIENYENALPGGSKMYPRFGLPAPYKRADSEDFYRKMTSYSPDIIEKRDVWVPELGSREEMPAVIYYFYGEAYAVVVDRQGVDLWYKVGCEHDWKTVESRMCYHESVCTKCGVRHVVDSSD